MTVALPAPRLAALSRPNTQLSRLTLFVALAALPIMAAHGLDDGCSRGTTSG